MYVPGVSCRRAFNSSLDVWPLLLLSTSETPESAGLGGREPATRDSRREMTRAHCTRGSMAARDGGTEGRRDEEGWKRLTWSRNETNTQNKDKRKQRKRVDTRRMASSGVLRRVAVVRTDVSKERSTFIRVTRIGELGTTLVVTSNRRLRLMLFLVHRFLSS
jgi:hypothetical protein